MLWSLACVGADPFRNEPPRLLSFNGAAVDKQTTLVPRFDEVPFGGAYEVRVEVEDPERGPVRVWFPYTEGTLIFDPDETDGVWFVPTDPADFDGVLLMDLEDSHDPPARRRYTIVWPYLYGSSTWFPHTGDTGAP